MGYDVFYQRLSSRGVEKFRHGALLVADLTNTSTEDYGLDVEAQYLPQIISLSPDTLSVGVESAQLSVNGNDFVPQSQILWNGSVLPTTFVDSRHLQTVITQQTFDSFGGSVGSSVLISVMSPAFGSGVGCPVGSTRP